MNRVSTLTLVGLVAATVSLAGNLSTSLQVGAGASYSRSHEGAETLHPLFSVWTTTTLDDNRHSGPALPLTIAGHIAYDLATSGGVASVGPRIAVADGQDGTMAVGADATFVFGHGGESSWEAVAELTSGPWHGQAAYEPSTKTQRYTAGVRVALP